MEYLKSRSLPYIEDPSNSDPKYLRVRIRRTILPMLERDNPRIRKSLVRTAETLGADLKTLEALAGEALDRMGRWESGALILDRNSLKESTPGQAARVIREAFHRLKGDRRQMERSHVEAVLSLVSKARGEAHLPAGYLALATADELIMAHREGGYLKLLEPVAISGPGRYLLSNGGCLTVDYCPAPESFHLDSDTAFLDPELVSWPLVVRPARPGDRIKPLGMTGSKKLSDLFIDLKIPRHKRSQVPVVVCGETVVWVAGAVLNRDFALGPGTEQALRLKSERASVKPNEQELPDK